MSAYWKLTDDGKFLHISRNSKIIGFIEILEIGEDNLKLESDDIFDFLDINTIFYNQYVFTFEGKQ